NILLIMADQRGSAVSSPFGSVFPTPNLERIAANRLRYTNFNSTALSSARHAARIPGRNPYQEWMGCLVYTSIMMQDGAMIGRVLKEHGYWTSWFGKDYKTPGLQPSQAGPFDRWQKGIGFDCSYSFVGDQRQPNLSRNKTVLQPFGLEPGHGESR